MSEASSVQFVAYISNFIHAIPWPCLGSNLFASSFSFSNFFGF